MVTISEAKRELSALSSVSAAYIDKDGRLHIEVMGRTYPTVSNKISELEEKFYEADKNLEQVEHPDAVYDGVVRHYVYAVTE